MNMKTVFNHLLILLAAAFTFSSCEKSGTEVVAVPGAAGSLKASATTLVLEKANQDKQAITFDFSEGDFGYQAAVSNVLQIAVKGTNFSAPKEVAFDPKVYHRSYSVLEFNALVLALNLPFDKPSQLELRLKSQISSSFQPVYSNVLDLTVTPYPLISWVYVPGDYQGWKPESADSLKSATGNGIYEGVILFPDVANATFAFKITPAKNWLTAYGDGGNGTVSTTGGDLKAPGAGSYRILLDLNANTIKLEPFSWGVIGDATPKGWDGDTDMKYNNGTGTWSVTLSLKAGTFKFRKNHDWGTNLGGSNGALAPGGDNIPITSAGTYTVVLNTANNTYTLTKQ